MTRTQIYLPEDLHNDLLMLAKEEKTTVSELLRKGADTIIKKQKRKKKKKITQKDAFEFFSNPPFQLKLTGKQLIELIRKNRDNDY